MFALAYMIPALNENLALYYFESPLFHSYQFNAFNVVNEKVIKVQVMLIDGVTFEVIDTDSINITVKNTDSYSNTIDLDKIADAKLKACVSAISYTYAEQYDQIECADQQVWKLEGLDQFTNLEILDVSGNLLVDTLDFTNFTNLKTLNVKY